MNQKVLNLILVWFFEHSYIESGWRIFDDVWIELDSKYKNKEQCMDGQDIYRLQKFYYKKRQIQNRLKNQNQTKKTFIQEME